MKELDWTDEDEPKKKRGIPKWLWIGCGVGCLGVVVLGALAGVLGVGFVKSATDPEKQWPRLQQVLHFEERPQNLELTYGQKIFGFQQYMLMDEEGGVMGTLQRFGGESAQFDKSFDPDFKPIPGLEMGAPQDAELVEVSVQGRKVRALRYSRISPEPEIEGGAGPGIRIDLTREGGDPRMIDMRRLGTKEPLTQEEIDAFLAPFDVWHEG
jgi:hypothetical protein